MPFIKLQVLITPRIVLVVANLIITSKNCPSRDNPEAIARAAMKFAIMRGNKTFMDHPTISKWQELGFGSKEVATKAVLIADPKTNKATRAKLLSSQLSQSSTSSVKAFTSFTSDDNEEESKLPASNSTSPSETNNN
jgi:hypothetical protein